MISHCKLKLWLRVVIQTKSKTISEILTDLQVLVPNQVIPPFIHVQPCVPQRYFCPQVVWCVFRIMCTLCRDKFVESHTVIATETCIPSYVTIG